MSMNCYAAHLYGAVLTDEAVRSEFEEAMDCPSPRMSDIAEYADSGMIADLPQGYPKEAEDVEYLYGPEGTVYVGYSASMPYEVPKYTQKAMDRNIRALLAYVFGPEKAERIPIEPIYDTWTE